MGWTPGKLPDLTKRVAVVTGGNSGIGFHTARELAGHGARVVLACRDTAAAERAAERLREDSPAGEIGIAELDLASIESVRAFASAWDGPLDLLINNAGVMAPPRPRTTKDGFELQFGTNHLGHFVLTGLLLDALRESEHGARVVTVASVAHRGGTAAVVDANAGGAGSGYNPQQTYSNSKLANLLFALQLHREFSERGLPITSTAAHPGVSATGLVGDQQGMGANRFIRVLAPPLMRLVTQGAAAGSRAVLYAATEAEAGSYTGPQLLGETRGRIGPARLSAQAQDEKLARRLWQVSEELTGYRYDWQ